MLFICQHKIIQSWNLIMAPALYILMKDFLGQAVRVANLYLLSSHCVTPSDLQYAGRSTQTLVRVLPSPVIVGYPSYGQGQWDVTNDETLYCMISIISRTISFDKHTL